MQGGKKKCFLLWYTLWVSWKYYYFPQWPTIKHNVPVGVGSSSERYLTVGIHCHHVKMNPLLAMPRGTCDHCWSIFSSKQRPALREQLPHSLFMSTNHLLIAIWTEHVFNLLFNLALISRIFALILHSYYV